MEISEVRIKLLENSQERLLAFCSITIENCFVIRDVKIIKGAKGPFVAMPSRKLCDRCPACGCKNHLRAAYCAQCGRKLAEDRSLKDAEGRAKLYADIAHPINSECRDKIQQHVLLAYERELDLAKQPGYVSRYEDYGEEWGDFDDCGRWDDPSAATSGQHRLDSAQTTSTGGPHGSRPSHTARRRDLPHTRQQDDFGDGVF